MKQVNLSLKQKQIIASSNSFGFDLFRKVNEISGNANNIMVSPLSVSMALGMTRNGASGTTLDAMTNTLGYSGMRDQEINESYRGIIETFSSLDPNVQLLVANSIWYRQNFNVEQNFIETNKQYFNAEVTALDFANASAPDIMNAWVKQKTNNLIPKIVDAVPAEAVMYLINAVYFKGQWKYQFEAEKTADKPFQLADGNEVQAPAMLQRATLRYMHSTDFEAIELPYNQGNYNMEILLPNVGKTVGDIAGEITQANWNTWSTQFTDLDIQLQLPKFKYEYDEGNLKEILTALGMGIAFDADNANFQRINATENLYISRIKHKTYIETNEAGSEAAAVTSVEIGTTSAGGNRPGYFTVNRPFIYFIQEKSTGTILFIGCVMNPNL